MRKVITIAGLVAASGCAPADQGIVMIQGVLSATPPLCTPVATGREFLPSMLVDIGGSPGAARNLTLPLKVRTAMPAVPLAQAGGATQSFQAYGTSTSSAISFSDSEVIYTTDDDNEDPALTLAGLPVSEDTKRVTGVSGLVVNEGAGGAVGVLAEALVFATVLTRPDIELLRADPIVSRTLVGGGPDATYRVFANLRLTGQTNTGVDIRSSQFSFPLDLCDGCLGIEPECTEDDDGDAETPGVPVAPVDNPESCFQGAEVPSFVCPDEA